MPGGAATGGNVAGGTALECVAQYPPVVACQGPTTQGALHDVDGSA